MARAGTARVQILNSAMALMSEETQALPGGAGSLGVDITGYANGLYYYRISMVYDDGSTGSLSVSVFVVAH